MFQTLFANWKWKETVSCRCLVKQLQSVCSSIHMWHCERGHWRRASSPTSPAPLSVLAFSSESQLIVQLSRCNSPALVPPAGAPLREESTAEESTVHCRTAQHPAAKDSCLKRVSLQLLDAYINDCTSKICVELYIDTRLFHTDCELFYWAGFLVTGMLSHIISAAQEVTVVEWSSTSSRLFNGSESNWTSNDDAESMMTKEEGCVQECIETYRTVPVGLLVPSLFTLELLTHIERVWSAKHSCFSFTFWLIPALMWCLVCVLPNDLAWNPALSLISYSISNASYPVEMLQCISHLLICFRSSNHTLKYSSECFPCMQPSCFACVSIKPSKRPKEHKGAGGTGGQSV